MSKQAIEGAKRGVLFHIKPESVKLWGIDYTSGPEDPTYNPRNKEPLDEGLVDSIMRLGMLEPIGVVKVDDELRVIYGNQRVRAAREANRRLKTVGHLAMEVPCLSPLRGLDDTQLGEVAIAENEHRRESSALTKSELAGIQLRRVGGNFKEAAKAFGLSEPQFRSLISLKEAAPELKEAIAYGRLSASAAIEIASLPREQQAERMEAIIAAGGTFEIARNKVRQVKGSTGNSKPTPSLIREVIAGAETHSLPEDFVVALRWVVGDLKASKVRNLSAALEAIGGVS